MKKQLRNVAGTRRGIAAYAILLLSLLGSVVTGGPFVSKGASDAEYHYSALADLRRGVELKGLSQTASFFQPSDSLSLAVPRRNHTATTLNDGRVLFIGGDNQNDMVSEAEMLDPTSRTISVIARSVTARTNHSATLLPDGKVLVVGGSGRQGSLRSTEIFDPATSLFSAGPDLRRPRFGHTTTVLKDGRILIAGGCPDNSVEIFDSSTNSFMLLKARMGIQRSFHGAVLLSTGDVLLVGGVGFYNGDTAEVFSLKDLRFSPTTNWLDANRMRPSLRVLPDGKVQIIGGDKKGTMELYDPKINRFRDYADLTATDKVLPVTHMLSAKTRAAFIQGAMNEQKGKGSSQLSISKDTQAAANELMARADYSYAEIEHLNRAVIAGGIDGRGQFLRSVMLVESSPSTLTTDKVEYAQQSNQYLQQSNPAISGTGWKPNEEIVIVRQQTETGTSISLHTVADANGDFTNTDIADNSGSISSRRLGNLLIM
jgi:WD40 repeat protein